MQAHKRLSLIVGVAETLRKAIGEGEVRDQLPNVRSLSQDLNVSVPTVLGAIKLLDEEGLLEVRQGHPTRILSSAGNILTKKGQTSHKVVILGFPPERIESSLYYREVEDALRRMDIEVEFHQFEKKIWGLTGREFDRLLARYQPDCWVLANCPPKVQNQFSEKGLPCILEGGAALPGLSIPDLEIDFSAVYRHAAHQFLNQGHKRIHFLIGDRSAAKNPQSIETFLGVIRERFPEVTRKSVVQEYDGTLADLRLVLERLFAGEVKPTGLFVALVSRMIFTQSWLLSNGYRIPEEVSLICRDSDEFVDCLVPEPARYAHSQKLAVRRLVRMILAMVEHTPLKDHTTFVPEYVPGETLGRAPE
jgi:DNA-binding transcriptional regulator YhcF (GntR family)